jgi:hypothetical protein
MDSPLVMLHFLMISSDAVINVSLSTKRRADTVLGWIKGGHSSFPSTLQTLTKPSAPPDTTRAPSVENATAWIGTPQLSSKPAGAVCLAAVGLGLASDASLTGWEIECADAILLLLSADVSARRKIIPHK